MLCALIMAGGKGTRFWPLSTEEKPKQFLNLIGEETMIQMTVNRIKPIIPIERIFVCTAFGLFCNGLEIFDKAHEEGVFEKVFTTNGVYQSPALLSRDWYQSVELSKYLAYFLDTINHDLSVSSLLDSSNKIDKLLKDKGLK